MRANLPIITASVFALGLAAMAAPASAACKKMGFTVNDYGKEGPTKDAKDLLDKDIAKWAADNNISKYTVGKKDVKCELFLDVLLFDEHTCTASASVCWGEGGDAKPAVKEAAPAKKTSTVETGGIPKESAPAPETKAAPEAAKAETAPASVAATEPAPAPSSSGDADAAERAAAAAERAAAAAERAAAAAEKASMNASSAAAPAETTPEPAAASSAPAEAPKSE